ncbi:MAG: ribbon-helix-helix domain-containing protein [Sulfobacillus sp.]
MLDKRTQIYLSAAQWRAVEDKSRRLGISCAEVIRRAIDADQDSEPSLSAVLDKVAGSWAHLSQFDEAYVERMRGEWRERSGG